ncbi:hypothetical protein GJ496_002158 [Pomphorhynchus laevis]|nr:hypothetical protein GJ496_002158 [Pomphorhynchus laevis]
MINQRTANNVTASKEAKMNTMSISQRFEVRKSDYDRLEFESSTHSALRYLAGSPKLLPFVLKVESLTISTYISSTPENLNAAADPHFQEIWNKNVIATGSVFSAISALRPVDLRDFTITKTQQQVLPALLIANNRLRLERYLTTTNDDLMIGIIMPAIDISTKTQLNAAIIARARMMILELLQDIAGVEYGSNNMKSTKDTDPACVTDYSGKHGRNNRKVRGRARPAEMQIHDSFEVISTEPSDAEISQIGCLSSSGGPITMSNSVVPSIYGSDLTQTTQSKLHDNSSPSIDTATIQYRPHESHTSCKICAFVFSERARHKNLIDHMAQHHDIHTIKLQCHLCGYLHTTPSGVSIHYRLVKSTTVFLKEALFQPVVDIGKSIICTVLIPTKEDHVLSCPSCSYTISSQACYKQLVQHFVTNHPSHTLSFLCSYCEIFRSEKHISVSAPSANCKKKHSAYMLPDKTNSNDEIIASTVEVTPENSYSSSPLSDHLISLTYVIRLSKAFTLFHNAPRPNRHQLSIRNAAFIRITQIFTEVVDHLNNLYNDSSAHPRLKRLIGSLLTESAIVEPDQLTVILDKFVTIYTIYLTGIDEKRRPNDACRLKDNFVSDYLVLRLASEAYQCIFRLIAGNAETDQVFSPVSSRRQPKSAHFLALSGNSQILPCAPFRGLSKRDHDDILRRRNRALYFNNTTKLAYELLENPMEIPMSFRTNTSYQSFLKTFERRLAAK